MPQTLFKHRDEIISHLKEIATDTQGNLTLYNQKVGKLRRGIEHLRKSDIFAFRGDYESAARESSESLKYIPECFEAIRAAADCLLMLEQFKESLQYYLTLIEKFPGVKDIHYQIGRCYSELKNFMEAIIEFEKEIEISEDAPDIQQQIGFAYEKLGEKLMNELTKMPTSDRKKKECRAVLTRAKRHYQNASKIINQDTLQSWIEEIDRKITSL